MSTIRNSRRERTLRVLRTLLRAAYDQTGGEAMIHVAGFVPWAYKYTNHAGAAWKAGGSHDPVPTEWKYAEILSCFNAFMDADAIGLGAMANASFYQHYPLAEHYPQNPRPTRQVADGTRDSRHARDRSYRGVMLHTTWETTTPRRGSISSFPGCGTTRPAGKTPLSWAFNPNLCERFPLGMVWTRENRSAQDYFVAGDSGAGYLNPGLLSPPRWHSDLPSGVATWERHCRRLYSQWDLSLTGFVIDGFAPGLSPEGLDAYARFSPDGIVPQKIPPVGVHRGMPFLRMGADLPTNPAAAARKLYESTEGPLPQFAVCRSILQTPSWYVQVERELQELATDEIASRGSVHTDVARASVAGVCNRVTRKRFGNGRGPALRCRYCPRNLVTQASRRCVQRGVELPCCGSMAVGTRPGKAVERDDLEGRPTRSVRD